MDDPLDNAKTMKSDMNHDTIGDMLTQQPDQAVVLASRYRIIRKLGEGGMGAVWLAEDTKLDGRQVAVKMLPSILAMNKRAIEQLKQEAMLAIKLSHPNIATLRGFEESEAGPFLVMDYIHGRTLEDILADQRALSEDKLRQIFRPVCDALEYAHSQKVIHRDIKPSNILVDFEGRPLLADFGVARELKDSRTRVTGMGTSGTLPYMSPEQLQGEPPSVAQDVYSLAATMYESVSGAPPFSRGDIQYQIVHTLPPPPSCESRLETAIMAGLSKEPSKRPPRAALLMPSDGSSDSAHCADAGPPASTDNGSSQEGLSSQLELLAHDLRTKEYADFRRHILYLKDKLDCADVPELLSIYQRSKLARQRDMRLLMRKAKEVCEEQLLERPQDSQQQRVLQDLSSAARQYRRRMRETVLKVLRVLVAFGLVSGAIVGWGIINEFGSIVSESGILGLEYEFAFSVAAGLVYPLLIAASLWINLVYNLDMVTRTSHRTAYLLVLLSLGVGYISVPIGCLPGLFLLWTAVRILWHKHRSRTSKH